VLTRNVLKAVASVMYIMYKVLYVMLNAAGLFFAYFLLMMLRLDGEVCANRVKSKFLCW